MRQYPQALCCECEHKLLRWRTAWLQRTWVAPVDERVGQVQRLEVLSARRQRRADALAKAGPPSCQLEDCMCVGTGVKALQPQVVLSSVYGTKHAPGELAAAQCS